MRQSVRSRFAGRKVTPSARAFPKTGQAFDGAPRRAEAVAPADASALCDTIVLRVPHIDDAGRRRDRLTMTMPLCPKAGTVVKISLASDVSKAMRPGRGNAESKRAIQMRKGTWPCSTRPERIVSDRGPEYLSRPVMEPLCLSGIGDATPRTPRHKAHAERIFRAVQRTLLPTLLGGSGAGKAGTLPDIQPRIQTWRDEYRWELRLKAVPEAGWEPHPLDLLREGGSQAANREAERHRVATVDDGIQAVEIVAAAPAAAAGGPIARVERAHVAAGSAKEQRHGAVPPLCARKYRKMARGWRRAIRRIYERALAGKFPEHAVVKGESGGGKSAPARQVAAEMLESYQEPHEPRVFKFTTPTLGNERTLYIQLLRAAKHKRPRDKTRDDMHDQISPPLMSGALPIARVTVRTAQALAWLCDRSACQAIAPGSGMPLETTVDDHRHHALWLSEREFTVIQNYAEEIQRSCIRSDLFRADGGDAWLLARSCFSPRTTARCRTFRGEIVLMTELWPSRGALCSWARRGSGMESERLSDFDAHAVRIAARAAAACHRRRPEDVRRVTAMGLCHHESCLSALRVHLSLVRHNSCRSERQVRPPYWLPIEPPPIDEERAADA